MNITFSKDIDLKCAEAYLRIKKKVERKDIQEYLKGKTVSNQLIESRIREYLISKRILEKDGSLTSIGKKVADDGKVDEYEEGKYKFWYAEKDNHLGTRILYLERIEAYPYDSKHIEEIKDLDIKDIKHLFLNEKNTVFEIKIDKIYGRKLDKSTQINFSWIWEGLEKSFYEFSGEIDKKNIINSGRIPQQFELEKEILKWIDWDTIHNRLKWRLEFNEDTLKSPIFEDFVHHYTFEKEGFRIELRDVPIMPIDKTHAEEWRDHLLLKQLEESYLNEDDFKYESKIIGEKEGLEMYELTEPDSAKFLKRRKNSINQKWHLQAPLDLNPNKHLSLGTPISFEKGIEFHFENFVSYFPSDFQNPDCVIISDLYAITKSNIKMLDSFLSVIRSKKNIVISNKKDDGEDEYYIKDYQKIKEKSELVVAEHIYETRKDVFHDRGIVLVKNKEYYILIATASFNTFLEWDKSKKIYKTRRSITYTPISEKYYDSNLMKFIKEKI